jgi:hemoglobin/transferrin/lactoferrin receptor protein
MKNFLFICILVFSKILLNAQAITVIDRETSLPIPSCNIFSNKHHLNIQTNSNGQADISPLSTAENIEISAFGYSNSIKSFSELESDNFIVKLKQSSVNLDEIVISATRWHQSSGDIPSKVVKISPKQTELQNTQTAADLLGISAKVFIQKSQQGGGSPMIRGFATNRLLYSIDGVRMNTAIFRGGNIQNVISLDPFALENTELFFGPGSVIYGSDAIGGVMSFQTLTPQLSINTKPLVTGKALARHSTANKELTGHFDINIGWKKLAFISSMSSNNYGDLKMGSYGPKEYLRPFYVERIDNKDVIITNPDPQIQKPSAYSQLNMMQKILYKPNEKWDFQYGFHYSETSDYSRYDRHIRYKNGAPRYGEWSYGPQKWIMNNLVISNLSKNALYDNFTIRLAKQYFQESRISRDINKSNREERIEKVDAYSMNLDFIKSTNKKNKLLYGLEFVLNDINSIGINTDITTNNSIDGPTRYPQSDWQSYAIYINDQFKVSDNVLLQTGLRYNQFLINAEFDTTFYPFPFTKAELNNGALTGSIGFVWKPYQSLILSANGATAFRSPNIDDLGKVFDSSPGTVTIPNPDLKAEYAYNGDLNMAKTFGKILKADLSVYYTFLDNALVRRDFTLNGKDSILYDGIMSQVQAMQNAAKATVFGIQAGLEIKLAYNFSFVSDFNYQKGEEELDNGATSPSRHAAPWFGVSKIIYNYKKLSLQLNSIYSGAKKNQDLPEEEKGKPEIYAKDENGLPYSPSWYTLNFNVVYNFTENFTISAGMENITDQRYRPYSSGIAGAGRNIILSLKCNF